MFRVIPQNLYEAEDRLWQQIRRRDELRSMVLDCLYELKQMTPLEEECRQLSGILERMDTEMNQQLQVVQALAEIRSRYIIGEERALEWGEEAGVYRGGGSITTMDIPVYENGVIRPVSEI